MPWSSIASLSTARRFTAGASDSKGNLYCATGFGTRSFEKFDGTSWSTLQQVPGERLNHSMTTDENDNVYVIGGRDASTFQATATGFKFNGSSWSPIPNLNTARFSYGLVADSTGAIYAIGGQDVNNDRLASVEILSNGSWSSGPSLPKQKINVSATIDSSDNIYLLGGQGGNTALEAFELSNGTWSALPNMPNEHDKFAATTDQNDNVYSIGGEGTDKVDKWDGSTWTTIDPLPQDRKLHGAGTDGGNIYAFAGANGNSTLASAIELTVASGPSIPTAPSNLSLTEL
jgi:N-acetylneuraminic acid mutarotase